MINERLIGLSSEYGVSTFQAEQFILRAPEGQTTRLALATVHGADDWSNGVRFLQALGFEPVEPSSAVASADVEETVRETNGGSALSVLGSWLDSGSGDRLRVVFLYDDPALWVAKYMQSGCLPSDGIRLWIELTKQAVHVARQYSDNCRFVRTADVISAPHDAALALSSWLNVELGAIVFAEKPVETPGGDLFNLIGVVAQNESEVVPEVLQQLGEFGGKPPAPLSAGLADAAFLAWKKSACEISAQAELEIEKERRLLTADIHDLQKRLADLSAAIEQENSLLKKQLKVITSSRSWKLTSPLRKATRVLSALRKG